MRLQWNSLVPDVFRGDCGDMLPPSLTSARASKKCAELSPWQLLLAFEHHCAKTHQFLEVPQTLFAYRRDHNKLFRAWKGKKKKAKQSKNIA